MKEELLARAALARRVTLASLAALCALFAVQSLFLSEEIWSVRWVIFLVQIVPFLLVLRGLIASRWRSYAWMLFFMQLYFVVMSLRMFSGLDNVLNWLALLLLSILFTSALLFVRWARMAEVTP